MSKPENEDKDGHVVIVLMPVNSGPVIINQPIGTRMEKRILKLMRDILPKEQS